MRFGSKDPICSTSARVNEASANACAAFSAISEDTKTDRPGRICTHFIAESRKKPRTL